MRIILAAVLGFAAATNLAFGQTYPERPIKVIDPNPGTGTDVSARLIAGEMSKRLGQPIAVEPMPGTAGVIALRAVMRSKPDGYTLFFGGCMGAIPVFMAPDVAVNCDPQLAPISQIGVYPFLMLSTGKLPVKNFSELVAYSKAHPGELNFGGPGVAALLFGEVLRNRTGLDFVAVPYIDNLKSTPALIEGVVAFVISGPSGWSAHIRNGAVRPLMVTTATRSPLMPDVPTVSELGVQGITIGSSLGFWGPPGLPRPIVQKLNETIVAVVKSPEVGDKLRGDAIGIEVSGTSPEEQVRIFQSDLRLYQEGSRLAKARPDAKP